MKQQLFILAAAFCIVQTSESSMEKIITVHDKTFKVSIPHKKIKERIKELGAQITNDYKDAKKPPVLIGVLRGAYMFLSDLAKEIDLLCEIDFVQVSSYQDKMRSSGSIALLQALKSDITDRDVIIVEDIIDTGLSIQYVRDMLANKNPRSIRIATLLDKQLSNVQFPVDYIAFHIPPEFVIGYGLDYNQQGRNLKDIYSLVSA